jgi:hypothetical protein
MKFLIEIVERIKASPLPDIIRGIRELMGLVIQFKALQRSFAD